MAMSKSVTGESERRNELWSTMVAGPIAGICSRFCVYPFDTIKARLQVQHSELGRPVQYRGTADALLKVVRADGPQGLYRGFLAVAVGSIPANMAYFGGYEMGKALVPEGSGMLGDMAVGAVAQLTAGVIFTPVDVVKERMQVQGVKGITLIYSGPMQAVQALLLERGPLGLMRGYWATNAVWIPWNMLFIALYGEAKRIAARHWQGASPLPATQQQRQECLPTARSAPYGNGSSSKTEVVGSGGAAARHPGGPATGAADSIASGSAVSLDSISAAQVLPPGAGAGAGPAAGEAPSAQPSGSSQSEELPPWLLGLCSAGAASLAGLLTHPVDVVKTRLQVMPAVTPGMAQPTARSIAMDMFRREGIKAFSKGATARMLMLAPGAALSWAIYEPVKRLLSLGGNQHPAES